MGRFRPFHLDPASYHRTFTQISHIRMHHHDNIQKVGKIFQGNMQRIEAILDKDEFCTAGIRRQFKTAITICFP